MKFQQELGLLLPRTFRQEIEASDILNIALPEILKAYAFALLTLDIESDPAIDGDAVADFENKLMLPEPELLRSVVTSLLLSLEQEDPKLDTQLDMLLTTNNSGKVS